MKFSGKVIAVTGAASGIGAETARLLKAEGAKVIAFDRNRPEVEVDQYIPVDLSDPSSVDQAVSQLDGSIDGLANIAGVPPTAGRDLVLKVNFLGLRRLTLGLIDKLNDNSSIVNVASMAGFGWTKSVPLCKSFIGEVDFDNLEDFCQRNHIDDSRSYFFGKEALIVWTMQNRWTWRERGIRINTVSPGPVDTPILQDFLESLGDRAEEDMDVMDRPGTPDDIAPAIVFLCSVDSKWLRGTNIACDGGLSTQALADHYQF
jgi:NAD(P)-dependent dehydrogenase (short-subunit alcohol dehydrogenase family)